MTRKCTVPSVKNLFNLYKRRVQLQPLDRHFYRAGPHQVQHCICYFSAILLESRKLGMTNTILNQTCALRQLIRIPGWGIGGGRRGKDSLLSARYD